MASALLPLIRSLLLSLLLYCNPYAVHGVANSHHVLGSDSLKPATACSKPKGSNRTLLAVTHRHGPCSPIPSKTRPTLGEILRQDQLRVNYLQQVASHGSRETRVQESQTSVPAKLGFALGSAEYVVTVGYGTPEQNQTACGLRHWK
ncbi:aspartyl protease family protein At5g10770-like [Phoenix dactylifera]|uniref:Aspartyl protease family protein At5g10770-like n=1 Tax=Phoenix dactylifera TaxID=42345 RepID=A0A8B8ZQ79_PHODC|nr:aspartyl protease family protein At5g10770-like [Phoenix dactylifera]